MFMDFLEESVVQIQAPDAFTATGVAATGKRRPSFHSHTVLYDSVEHQSVRWKCQASYISDFKLKPHIFCSIFYCSEKLILVGVSMFIKVKFPTVDCDTLWFIFFNIESPRELLGACQAVHYECRTHKWKFECVWKLSPLYNVISLNKERM